MQVQIKIWHTQYFSLPADVLWEPQRTSGRLSVLQLCEVSLECVSVFLVFLILVNDVFMIFLSNNISVTFTCSFHKPVIFETKITGLQLSLCSSGYTEQIRPPLNAPVRLEKF